jgi:inorganic pyrophosphatase
MPNKLLSPFDKLEPFDAETGDFNVIIETPKNCRNKYAYDEKLGVFALKGVLAVGHSFPFDFGFIPQTLAATATRSMFWF